MLKFDMQFLFIDHTEFPKHFTWITHRRVLLYAPVQSQSTYLKHYYAMQYTRHTYMHVYSAANISNTKVHHFINSKFTPIKFIRSARWPEFPH